MTKITTVALIIALGLTAGIARADVAPPSPREQAMSNKALVTEMFQKMFVEMKVDENADTYLAKDFIEHDPEATNGVASLKAYFKNLTKHNPKMSLEMKRVIADGDLVLVHFHMIPKPGDRGVAGVDIFRIASGKVVEHWDVMQPVPEKSANINTMF